MDQLSLFGRKTFVGGAAWGSEAKGSVVGYLARRHPYTAAVAAFPPSTGHTFKWDDKTIMNMMLPISVVSPTVRDIFIGPGALIDPVVMEREIATAREMGLMEGKRLLIHEHAGVVLPTHSQVERDMGLTKIGSTVKGGMAAQFCRMRRDPEDQGVAREKLRGTGLEGFVVDRFAYAEELRRHEDVMIEGSQGFGLSMYHGAYPYTTARDTTPYAVFSDCGIPWDWAGDIECVWTARTRPIRVNNRDGSSGPCYPDQSEISFEALDRPVELTTVTKLPRRIFTFSVEQIAHLRSQCMDGRSWVALTFADYVDDAELRRMLAQFEALGVPVRLINYGPHDSDMWTYARGEVAQ